MAPTRTGTRAGSTAAGPEASAERFAGLKALRGRVRSRPGGALAWRIGVTVVSVVIIAGGIVLLPLPGPGWVIIFAGLGLLATEYTWAARLLTFARAKVRDWTQWLGRQPIWVRGLAGLVTLAIVVGCGFLAWRLTR